MFIVVELNPKNKLQNHPKDGGFWGRGSGNCFVLRKGMGLGFLSFGCLEFLGAR